MIKQYLSDNLTEQEKQLLDFNSRDTQHTLDVWNKSIINQTFELAIPNVAETNPQLAKDLSYICVSKGYAKSVALHNYAKLIFNQTLLNKDEILVYDFAPVPWLQVIAMHWQQ